MLTIFAIPKPFEGQISIIQKNAIQSWTKLHPDCEVILLGDEPGTAIAAAEFKIRHIPRLKLNEFGTPLVSSAFEQAQAAASHPTVCYVNADIILLNDFSREIQKLNQQFVKFLMVGRRWNVDISHPIDFGKPDWETVLRRCVAESGKLFSHWGIDYFAFRRGQFCDMPPFAVGRPSWDNWMIFRARFLQIPVIDATAVVTAIHQNHGYQHVPMGRNGTFRGPEGDKNLELTGGRRNSFTLLDASLILKSKGLSKPKITYASFVRYLETLSVLKPEYRFIATPFYVILAYPVKGFRKIKKRILNSKSQ